MTTSSTASGVDGHARSSPLRLRHIDAAVARVGSAIAGGRHAEFELDGQAMLVRVAGASLTVPADMRDEAAMCFETAHGFVNLRHCTALLRLLTGVDLDDGRDTGPDADTDLRRWEVGAAAERLPVAWRSLFDVVALHDGWRAQEEARVALWLRWRNDDGGGNDFTTDWAVGGWLCGEAAVLEKILSLPHWRSEEHAGARLLERLPVRRPVQLGTTRLAIGEFGALGKGDLVFIDSPCFDRNGAGTAWFGKVGMSGYLVSDQPAMRFQFEKWSTRMDDSFDDYQDEELDDEIEREEHDEQDELDEFGAQDEPDGQATLDELPMRLVFEVGTLSLPLGELKRLAPGSVLDLERALPPSVTVRCGGRELARGELVEVDGRLAVEITDMWIRHERDV
jgi:type III secretion protein Q